MRTNARPTIRPVRGLAITRDRPVLIEIDDDELLAGGPRNRMSITVWVGHADADGLQPTIARALTISFLERALAKVRTMPAEAFESSPLRRAVPVIDDAQG
ncbi:MAG: hypothetical protein Q7T55_17420 [Solirubrobacteraceae bacterium]|nr:hypothetical protein [Solirubrobacteraceae bacterium]